MFRVFFSLICIYYLISPALTVINFTILNGTDYIVYFLIAFPFFMSILFVFTIPYARIKLGGRHLFAIIMLFIIVIFSAVRSYDNVLVMLPSFLRFFSSISFVFFGFYFYRNWLETKNINKIAKYGFAGGCAGIIVFFTVRALGYSMTHSITADGMLAPIMFYYVSKPSLLMLMFFFSVVLLSGKGANLVAFIFGYLTVSFNNKKFVFFVFVFVFFGVLISSGFYEVILPSKLVMRIDLLNEVLKGNRSLDDGAGYVLTSSRYNEVIYLFDKWKAQPSALFFGSGLATAVDYGGEQSRNTIHMSYFKIIDMIGIVGFIFIFYLIVNSLIDAVRFKNNKNLMLYSYFIIINFVLAFFQYSLLQDPMFWTSMGILLYHNKKLRTNQ